MKGKVTKMAFKKFNLFDSPDDSVEETEDEFYTVSANDIKNNAAGKMILVEPRAYSESQAIADHLKSRNSVVVNFKRVTADQQKRIIDFILFMKNIKKLFFLLLQVQQPKLQLQMSYQHRLFG